MGLYHSHVFGFGNVGKFVEMKKTVFILFGFLLLITIIAAIYFVGGVSAVYSPLKKYGYFGNVEGLLHAINLYKSDHHNILFEFEDTVGNLKKGYAFYYTVTIKANGNTSSYDLEFANTTGSNQIKSTISLIGAHDPTNKMGGYKMNDNGVKKLILVFQNYFIDSLNSVQNTNIKEISVD